MTDSTQGAAGWREQAAVMAAADLEGTGVSPHDVCRRGIGIQPLQPQKLLVSDPAIAGLKIDGTFSASNVEAFLDAVQVALKVYVEARGDEAVISH